MSINNKASQQGRIEHNEQTKKITGEDDYYQYYDIP